MKKLILFLSVFAITLSSCGNDDDTTSQDPFIGTWTFFKLFINGVEETLSDCEKQNKIQVDANGVLSISSFDDFTGTCELEETTAGTWENLGSGRYSTTIDGDVTETDITFEGNTFFFEDVDGTDVDKTVYIKN